MVRYGVGQWDELPARTNPCRLRRAPTEATPGVSPATLHAGEIDDTVPMNDEDRAELSGRRMQAAREMQRLRTDQQ